METTRSSAPAKRKVAFLSAAAFLLLATSAQAQIVLNGGFESTTNGYGQISNGTGAAATGNTAATDWTTSGYNFVMDASNAITGVPSQYGTFAVWGTGNGGNDSITASPNGGNFVALDGDFNTAAITQTLTGLTPGDWYSVSFDWGASQQNAFNGYYDGPTMQSLTVGFGSETQTTTPYDLGDHDFSGWMAQTDSFKATSSTEVLSFLANGSPMEPPFVLLDGISVHVSEGGASSMYLLMAAAVCFGAYFVSKRKRLDRSAK
jgi:hypothetical protein